MFSICLFGCEKLDIPSDYPSTYLKQPLDSISIWQSEYISRNPYLTSSLNEYGFCDVVVHAIATGIRRSIFRKNSILTNPKLKPH